MAKERTLNPTVDTMVSTAIERRKEGKPPASVSEEGADEKAELAPLNKMEAAPVNKAKKAPAKKKATK